MITAKEVLTQTMYELMSNSKIDKISVDDIIKTAKVSRSSFYRYFKDKYDLMHYCYSVHLEEILNCGKQMSGFELNEFMFTRVRKHKAFFTNAIKSEGIDSMETYLVKYWIDIFLSTIEEKNGKPIDANSQLYDTIVFTSAGMAALAKNWILRGMTESPHEMALRISQCIPSLLSDDNNE